MKRTSCFLIALLVLAVSGMTHAGQLPEYIQAPPMAQVVKTPVGEVKSGPTKVPMITWAAEVVTIFANGNSLTTVKGSIFDQAGLNLTLFREDDLKKQVEMFISGETPYLRVTHGMGNLLLDLLSRDPRTTPVAILQMTWSREGDVLVAKSHVKTVQDLCGKTIVVQAYGPHVDFFTKVVTDACGSVDKVKVRWVRDLVGLEGNTPGAAFRLDSSIDAAFVISPDADALTTVPMIGGRPTPSAEYHVPGAHKIFSTLTADRIIPDEYWVRSNYLQSHRTEVEKFVHGWLRADEAVKSLIKTKQVRAAEYNQMISAAAKGIFDAVQATADVEGLIGGAEFVGYRGNVKFFSDPSYPRNFDKLTGEVQTAFMTLGFLSGRVPLDHARWDYNRLKAGLTDIQGVEAPRFDAAKVAKVIDRKVLKGTLEKEGQFYFEIHFGVNQKTFPADQYREEFSKVIERATTYGGAVITIEGHSDPYGYWRLVEQLQGQSKEVSEELLRRNLQAAKDISLGRANAVRDSVITAAKEKSITLDPSQFSVHGHGIMRPKSGKICQGVGCKPQNKQEQLVNMRVEFRLIVVEAEEEMKE